MELEQGERIIFEGHPSWRSMLVFYLKGAAVGLGLAALTTLVYAITSDVKPGRIGAVFAVVMAVTLVVGYLRRWATVYTITSERLRIKKGIVARKVQQTRLNRVQNVNHEQGVLDRFLNIGRVDFDTAGTDDFNFVFDGVADPEGVIQAVDQAETAFQREHEPAGGIEPAARR